MSDELRVAHRPELTRPVLITAFRGWNDGGQGASLAGGYLAKTWSAARFAEIEPEGFFDFQVTRPHVSLVDGETRRLDWPDNAFYHSTIPRLGRDAVLMLGIEPNLRWNTFTGLITGLARELGVELVITLGSLLADVPHTRPSPVTGGGTEGPTGIVGVLHDACARVGLPSVSLWAAVPHYVSLAPSPRAALALCNRLAEILDADIDTSELDEASDRYSEQVSEAVASDEETAAYVAELEQRADVIADEDDLPSGESLAAELTRFLREREKDDGQPDGPSEQP